MDDDGGDVEERELQVGHVNGAEVYVDGCDAKLLLVIEALLPHFTG